MKITVGVKGNEQAAISVAAPDELNPARETLLASAYLSLDVIERLFGGPVDMIGPATLNFSPEPSGEPDKIISITDSAKREATIRLPEKDRLNALGESYPEIIQAAAVAAALLEAKSRAVGDLTEKAHNAVINQASAIAREILERILELEAPGKPPDEVLGPDVPPEMRRYTHPLFQVPPSFSS